MGLHKILKYVALALGVVGLILLGRVIATGDEAIKSDAAVQGSVVDPFMFVAYVVLAIVLVLVLFYVVKGIFAGDIKKTLISIGAFVLVVAISYGISEGVETPMKDGEVLSASGARWVGAGLRTFYILAFVAIGTMLFSGIKKLIAK
ncbi:hypothetical protein [Gilvibacter sp.]|uniref:hypothetical protein n=1 Tax=Gilvibacter sp. TaxID=2729997 RepID=UPI003F49ECA1